TLTKEDEIKDKQISIKKSKSQLTTNFERNGLTLQEKNRLDGQLEYLQMKEHFKGKEDSGKGSALHHADKGEWMKEFVDCILCENADTIPTLQEYQIQQEHKKEKEKEFGLPLSDSFKMKASDLTENELDDRLSIMNLILKPKIIFFPTLFFPVPQYSSYRLLLLKIKKNDKKLIFLYVHFQKKLCNFVVMCYQQFAERNI
ncbi:hypothetical protein RFI_18550, partial [Reticulomyxa filosa]